MGSLQEQIIEAKKRTVGWFEGQLYSGSDVYGLFLESKHHDPDKWPDMLLPGTYNALLGLNSINEMDTFFDDSKMAALGEWLLEFRTENGYYRMPGITDETIGKVPHFNPDAAAYYTLDRCWEYVNFHITNYTIGGLETLGLKTTHNLDFVDIFFDPKEMLAWLALRDMRDPWAEGNFIVNLASFLFLKKKQQPELAQKVDASIKILTDWHYRYMEPSTGFWGISQHSCEKYALHAMAGACHNYHLFFEQEIPIPHMDSAVDWCLKNEPQPAVSACIDVDFVDVLANAYFRIDHRRSDVKEWLEKKLVSILAIQNSDGGFPDEPCGDGKRFFDTWRGGYSEPQGISCNFSTAFRWFAIAMISDVLWPDWNVWNFRDMIGIGYYKRGSEVGSL